MSTRNNQVILCNNINNSRDYSHVINFNVNDMWNLCVTNAVYSGNDFSIIRHTEGKIKIQVAFNIAQTADYIAIKDTSLSNKIYFGWVDDIEYISDRCTEITFTVDQWATWRGQMSFNRAYVERQHQSVDTFGSNLEPEPIQVDTYVTNVYGEISANPDRWRAVLSEVREGEDQYVAPDFGYMDAEGLPHTMEEWDAPLTGDILGIPSLRWFSTSFGNYVKEGHGESLLGLSMYHSTGDDQTLILPRLTSLDGHVPVNNKCLQYPFCVTKLSNNAGAVNLLKPELFGTTNQNFRMLSVNCGVGQSACRPLNYAGMAQNWDHAVTINDYPQIPVPVDSYKMWMGQNKVLTQQAVGRAINGGITSALSNLATGNIFGAIMGGVSGAIQAAEIQYAYDNHPDNAGDSVIGRAGGNYVNISAEKMCYTIEQQSVKRVKAAVIDSFFTRYGYAQNKVMQVSTNNDRFNHHYVKIASGECALRGPIPRIAFDTINKAFQRGITIHQSNTTTI